MANQVEIPFTIQTLVSVKNINSETVHAVVPVVGANVTITNRATSTPAKAYSSEGGAEITGSILTNEFGQIAAWVEEGPYTITVGGGTPALAATVYDFDAVSGRGAEKVAAKSITENELVEAVAQALNPPGTILEYCGLAAPAGYVLCHGQAYKTTEHPNLFAVLGYEFVPAAEKAAKETAKEYCVPDVRGRVLIGAGSGAGLTTRALAEAGGKEKVKLSISLIPAHNHAITITDPGHNHAITDPAHTHAASSEGATVNIKSNLETNFVMSGNTGSGLAYVPNVNSTAAGAFPLWYGTIGYHIGETDHAHGINVGGNFTGISINTKVTGITAASTNTGGAGEPEHENVQPYLCVSMIIKT